MKAVKVVTFFSTLCVSLCLSAGACFAIENDEVSVSTEDKDGGKTGNVSAVTSTEDKDGGSAGNVSVVASAEDKDGGSKGSVSVVAPTKDKDGGSTGSVSVVASTEDKDGGSAGNVSVVASAEDKDGGSAGNVSVVASTEDKDGGSAGNVSVVASAEDKDGGSAGNVSVVASTTEEEQNHSADCRYNKTGFNPFFRTSENDDKCPLPEVPPLNVFDQAMLLVCGEWGHKPDKQDFLNMLNDPSLEGDVKSIYDALQHEVFMPEADFQIFKNELADLWFTSEGMIRVFCGEPTDKKLLGMHFYGRYMQAQENQWAGRDYSQEEEKGNDWDFAPAITFKTPKEEVVICGRHRIDVSHAADIITKATQAYKAFRTHLPESGGKQCIYNAENGSTYALVAEKKSIVKFHPMLESHPVCPSGADARQCDCVNYVGE